MADLQRITPSVLQQLKSLLADFKVPVKTIIIKYKDYVVRNEGVDEKRPRPLLFQWSRGKQSEPLFFGFYTWGTAESKKYPDTFLALGTNSDFRIVGFPLYLLPQDKGFVYLSFKLGNNEGGKNRWFGRGRSSKELRSVAQTDQLALDLRGALQKAFPDPLFSHPTLSGEWLSLARLPLADLKASADLNRRIALKTLIFEKLLQAFVIAEKLRDDSLKASGMQPGPNETTEEYSPILMPSSFPLNQILYGPPGTGKTHHTKARAVGIIENLTDEEIADAYTREEIRELFEGYRKGGQVEFVTFHQAFGYEDFVEGIKPVIPDGHETAPSLNYMMERGVFKRLVERGLYAIYLQQQQRLTKATPLAEVAPISFDDAFVAFINSLRERLETEAPNSVVFADQPNTRWILQDIGTDGTAYLSLETGSVRYPVTRDGLRRINAVNSDPKQELVVRYGRNFSVYRTVFQAFRQFWAQWQTEHPRSVSQSSIDDNTELQRVVAEPEIAGEIRKNINFQDLLSVDFQQAPRFVLIIDEINRGNVANIFGELITLLEDDKRTGRPEALTVRLPYSKEDFTVPENLYLLGTMNTADRSVEALDTALRRRFSFTEMRPEPQVIREQVGENGVLGTGDEAVDVARLLEVLNSRLEQLLDHDHCLGHALLLRMADVAGLRAAFQRNILPLLQEYFFGDWGKIGLVLGERFVAVADKAAGRAPLAKFGGYDTTGLRDKPLYRLTTPDTWDAAAFRSIYAAT
jgi:5-methylcytosine-specific restriction protein B